MSAFHCPLGALKYQDPQCIDCGLCYVDEQEKKWLASQKVRAQIRKLNGQNNRSEKVRKIAICGKGGVGKSTITSLLTFGLVEKGYKVVVLDADESNPGLHRKLGLEKLPASIYEDVKKSEADDTAKHWHQLEKITLRDIPANFIEQDQAISYLMIGKINDVMEGCACAMADSAREMLIRLSLKDDEILIVDQEAGVENFGRGVERGADTIINIVEPSYESIELSEKINYMAQGIGITRVKTILNKVPSRDVENIIKERLHHHGMEVLGSLYQDGGISLAAFEGRLIENTQANEAIEKMIEQLL
ncbi:MAG: P-loop NTPase [Firmicutes bacterium]|nr:P-loop NTPase [Bacillota bacterium]